ncbi:MAG TPA: glycerophosphodiester phosphodiesterase family protein [Pyrinomonadaceae bacterium]|jgi:glycerophosphoryl diester phosphodiesterase|nr:glycerophosphodiester phosphodiesterase family protein [Pyrinomonadaceae bacterium]
MRRAVESTGRLPLIIGHRGACARAPENTFASFDLAFTHEADGIEFDVRLARDGVPVVIHDPTLLRTVQADGVVESFDSKRLSQFHAGAWFNEKNPGRAVEGFEHERIPLLSRVFERYGDRHLYVEMKCEESARRADLARAVVLLVREHELGERLVVKSFEHDALVEVKKLAPEIRTAALFDRSWQRPFVPAAKIIAQAEACGADEISLHRSLLRRATVERARARGFEVVVWTVNSPFWLRRATAFGLRAVITDDPSLLRDALRRNQLNVTSPAR